MGKIGAGLEVLEHGPKHRPHTCDGLDKTRTAGGLHGGIGIDRSDLRIVRRNLLHDDIATQHLPGIALDLKHLVRKRGVESAELVQQTVDLGVAVIGPAPTSLEGRISCLTE
ncbi:MAG: hypothetical protein ABI155_10860 [Paralcaligenes sp.]